jgi:hypothetical protein
MKKIIPIFALIFFLFFELAKTSSAQTYSCYWNSAFSTCMAQGTCTPPATLDISPCAGGTAADCSSRLAVCITPTAAPTAAPGSGGSGAMTCSGGTGINTAIGCIPFTDLQEFMAKILTWGIGVGGGLAFLFICFAAFQIITSAGDPKRLQAGHELLTSAITGLIMLIFSAFILKVIGVDIFGIPGI